MPSPRRIYRYFSTPEIEELLSAAKGRQRDGAFTSMSGMGHSHTKQFAKDEEVLFEATYELNIRNGTVAPSRTSADFSGLLENNTTVDV